MLLLMWMGLSNPIDSDLCISQVSPTAGNEGMWDPPLLDYLLKHVISVLTGTSILT